MEGAHLIARVATVIALQGSVGCRIEENPDFIDPADSVGTGSTSTTTTEGMTSVMTTEVTGTTDPSSTSTTTTTTTTTSGSTSAGGLDCTEIFYAVDPPPNLGTPVGNAGPNQRGGIYLEPQSMLVGRELSCWAMWMRASGPEVAGPIVARIRDMNDDVVTMFVEAVEASELGEDFAEFTFTLAQPHTLAADDRILVEYEGPSEILLGSVEEVFDGNATRGVIYRPGTGYIGEAQARDAVGTLGSL